MKKIILILLLTLSIHADVKSTYEDTLVYLEDMIDIDNNQTNTLAQRTYKFYKNLNIPQKTAKAEEIYKNSKEKIRELAVSGLIKIHCSDELNEVDKEECVYWSKQAQAKTADIEKLKQVTYQLKIQTEDNTISVATAVALSRNGKLVTAYHNIDAAKSIVAVDYKGAEYNVKLGEVSVENNLAYLYAEVKNIDFAKISLQKNIPGDKVFILNAKNFLLEAMVSKIKNNVLIINTEFEKDTSGAGVFNARNELVAIALSKDVIINTLSARPVNVFKEIKNTYQKKPEALSFDNSDYDTSDCENEDNLAIWNKHAKSSDLYIQELHALFLGLCQKINHRDLTTDEAQIIYESNYKRLFRK
ncbi:MAG: trypsin-like peptidase domain-containing protein [Helicobacteraceae bacterium]|nr:trypsin-like peptidase domain-containing protein [Candidatus Sulfurimonas ponti]MBL6973059.1 trypsin-like peptidase domain-containing protein [Sulfurimonas sp.]